MVRTNKKILITGGAGYIGAHTVHYLLQHGTLPQDIVVVDNLSQGHKHSVPAKVILVVADLKDRAAVREVFSTHRFDAVLHFAGSALVAKSMQDPGSYFENNTMASLNLLQAMKEFGCQKLVFSSTCAVYGNTEQALISEDHPERPVNPYGESKLSVDRMLNWFATAHGIRSVSLRYFNAAGAAYGLGEDHTPETHLIPLLFQSVLAGTGFSIYGYDYPTRDGTCIRDYVHVKDLAAAHRLALAYLDSSDKPRNVFNLGFGRGVSVKEVVSTAEKVLGKPIEVYDAGRRPGDPPALVADAAKASTVLGWRPQLELQQILASAWEWHSEHQLLTAER